MVREGGERGDWALIITISEGLVLKYGPDTKPLNPRT